MRHSDRIIEFVASKEGELTRPERALREYFEARVAGPRNEAIDRSCGLVQELEESRGANPRGPEDISFSWNRSSLEDEDEESATVDFQATLTMIDRRAFGKMTSTTWYSGPGELKKVQGEWKVSDFKTDGLTATESLRLSDKAARNSKGLVITPLLARITSHGFFAHFKLHNNESESVWAHEAYCGTPRLRMLGSRLPTDLTVAPGAETFAEAACLNWRGPLPKRLRIYFPYYRLESRRWKLATIPMPLSRSGTNVG